MKKLLLMMLLIVGGISTASAWGDLYLICGENSDWTSTNSDAFKFTCLAENSYRATVPGSYIENGKWYFRFRDTSDGTSWLSISPESDQNDQEITSSVYSTNWQNSSSKAFYISQNAEAKYVHIYANWNTSTEKWDLTSSVITDNTTYSIAFTNPSGWSEDNVKVYSFLDGVTLTSAWPGNAMTKNGDIYTASITGSEGARVIFSNNGSTQSWTLDLVDNGVYNTTERVANVTASAGAYGMATFSSAYPLDFTGITTVSAYTITAASNGNLTKTQVTGMVPANTGLYIEGDVDASADVPTTIYTGSVGKNMLVAAASETKIYQEDGDNTNYILTVKTIGGDVDTPKFYRVNGTSGNNVSAGKAYLQIPTASAAREILWFDDDVTAIENLTPALNKVEGVVFDLQGRRVMNPTKGLYIVNGKKTIIK